MRGNRKADLRGMEREEALIAVLRYRVTCNTSPSQDSKRRLNLEEGMRSGLSRSSKETTMAKQREDINIIQVEALEVWEKTDNV